MAKDYSRAILNWRENVTKIHGGLDAFDQSPTISTMLFGCNRWLEEHEEDQHDDIRRRIVDIKSELEAWKRQRNLTIY